MAPSTAQFDSDAVVVGGGMAGRAACIHLARAGMKVICIEPRTEIGQPVGESLDWSSPDLLKALGLPMEWLVSTSVATWKRHVTLKMPSGAPEHYVPVPWLARQPFNVEVRTIHVDRVRLDDELMDAVVKSGVNVVHEKVAGIQSEGKRVTEIQTESGRDTRRSGLWMRRDWDFAFRAAFSVASDSERAGESGDLDLLHVGDVDRRTTLYMEPQAGEYLDWVWEIPVQPNVVSVGYVITGTGMKARREPGERSKGFFGVRWRSFHDLRRCWRRRPGE